MPTWRSLSDTSDNDLQIGIWLEAIGQADALSCEVSSDTAAKGAGTFMTVDKATLQAARISAKSAVVVALITTLGGVVAGYLVRPDAGRGNVSALHWLTIERIESDAPADVRVLITVNGLRFSYPSSSVWQELQPGMTGEQERFLLPPSEDSYRVSFHAFEIRGPHSDSGESTSSVVEEIPVDKIPTGRRSYDLYGIVRPFTRGGSPTRGGTVSLRVSYSIE